MFVKKGREIKHAFRIANQWSENFTYVNNFKMIQRYTLCIIINSSTKRLLHKIHAKHDKRTAEVLNNKPNKRNKRRNTLINHCCQCHHRIIAEIHNNTLRSPMPRYSSMFYFYKLKLRRTALAVCWIYKHADHWLLFNSTDLPTPNLTSLYLRNTDKKAVKTLANIFLNGSQLILSGSPLFGSK